MKHVTMLVGVLFVLLTAGCPTVQPLPGGFNEADAYQDVAVPGDFAPYDNPPFKREDSRQGKRIYGVYSYRSKEIYPAARLADWFKKELPDRHGWDFINEELDAEKNTWRGRFEKKGDKLDLSVAPDKLAQSSERFSILVVKMNDPGGN